MNPQNIPNSFHPGHISRPPTPEDPTRFRLLTVARVSLLVLALLLPVFFVPTVSSLLGFSKSGLSFLLVTAAAVALGLAALRTKRVATVIPWALVAGWVFVAISLLSTIMSGDVQDSLRGNYLEVTTTAFSVLLLLVMSVTLSFQGRQRALLAALGLFAVSATLLLAYCVLRFMFGSGTFDFTTFTALAITPIGTINDLAVLAGALLLAGLVTMLHLPARGWLLNVVMAVAALALFVIAVADFYLVWVAVAGFATILLLYAMARNQFNDTVIEARTMQKTPVQFMIVAGIVAIVGWGFVSTDYFGMQISKLVPVDYLEVRPSLTSTIAVAEGVYAEDLLLGTGPNRFSDAWRLHKNQLINQTAYWNVDFTAGYGYVPTLFVTHGLLGGLAMVLFHLLFLYFGLRTLLGTGKTDPTWYYLGLSSFAVASFIWVVSYVYVPSPGVLLLAAFFSGVTFACGSALAPRLVRHFELASSRQRGFVVMSTVVLLVAGLVGSTFSVGKQFAAQYVFAGVLTEQNQLEDVAARIGEAKSLYKDDRFSNVQAQLLVRRMNALLAIPEPNDEDAREFTATGDLALQLAGDAVALDRTDPANHFVLAGVFSTLSRAGSEPSLERAFAAIEEAKQLDPKNPAYPLARAQLAWRVGDQEGTASAVGEALSLKPNYTEALYLDAQLSVARGDVAGAIEKTRSVIALEPRNPTRYFQLGVLYAATENSSELAMQAFEAAITLDPAYANARYLLALEYIKRTENEAALTQLREVQKTNPDNAELLSIIADLEAGEEVELGETDLLETTDPTSLSAEEESAVAQDEAVTTDLISPVNRPTTESSEAGVVEQSFESALPTATTTVEEETISEETTVDTPEVPVVQ